MNATPSFRLHRVKSDETADDTDYIATATAPDAEDCSSVGAITGYNKHPVTGIEILVIGVTDAGVPQATSAMTIDLQVVGAFTRSNPATGGTKGRADGVFRLQTEDDLNLHDVLYYPLNGAERFFVRVLGDTGDDVDNLEIWWRPVSR